MLELLFVELSVLNAICFDESGRDRYCHVRKGRGFIRVYRAKFKFQTTPTEMHNLNKKPLIIRRLATLLVNLSH